MKEKNSGAGVIDYIEIYSSMAKPLAYWHTKALGFSEIARAQGDEWIPGRISYVLSSGEIRLVLTSEYPILGKRSPDNEVGLFVNEHYCGVKKIALRVESVPDAFERAIKGGAFPIKFPATAEDEFGSIEEASIGFLGDSEIVFIDRKCYSGVFKPGFKPSVYRKPESGYLLQSIDHIASEVRINESRYWTNYLQKAIGTELVQSIESGEDNRTGMILNISQGFNKKLTFVISEPEPGNRQSKVQENIDMFGPGIHHLAFSTDDMIRAIKEMSAMDVDFVSFPDAYYDLIRKCPEFDSIDLGILQEKGILIDKEGDGYLMQKFIKAITERPFFIYELISRVDGYNGFALRNINMLKKAEEIQVMK